VTTDDLIYGLGSNEFGRLGFGHTRAVNSPQIIPELCHKNIQEFLTASTFVLGITGAKCIIVGVTTQWVSIEKRSKSLP